MFRAALNSCKLLYWFSVTLPFQTTYDSKRAYGYKFQYPMLLAVLKLIPLAHCRGSWFQSTGQKINNGAMYRCVRQSCQKWLPVKITQLVNWLTDPCSKLFLNVYFQLFSFCCVFWIIPMFLHPTKGNNPILYLFVCLQNLFLLNIIKYTNNQIYRKNTVHMAVRHGEMNFGFFI